jgi:putative ABC transport system permease protein
MHILPILSTLRRHRTTAALIILEIALTCAIVCNAVFLIRDRLSRMDQSSGLDEDELIRIQITGIDKSVNAAALTVQDLQSLRAIPGVRRAVCTNMLPFSSSSWTSSARTDPGDPSTRFNAATYMGGAGLLETWGVQLVAGRDFTPEEYVDYDTMRSGGASPGSVIITRQAAEQLLPGKNPLGQRLYVFGKDPQLVVGVIDRLAISTQSQSMTNRSYAMVFPINVPYTVGGTYVLRVDPARRSEVLAAVDGALARVDRSRIVLSRQSFTEIRDDFFRQDRSMAYLLSGVSLALLAVTGFGIVGLASFWVQQRTRQIGVRRALGATRGDIVRYFLLENFLLATAGIAIGMALAYAINQWLMHRYQIARLPVGFLPVGACLLWLLGQLAVLGPALRAATISPASATRSL